MWILNGMRYITVILSVLLKHNFALFILKYFIKQLHLIPSFLKLVGRIPLYVPFAANHQKLCFMCFASVKIGSANPKFWEELLQLINDNLHADYTLDNHDLMFGVSDDSLVTFLILCCKFYIYIGVNFKKCPQTLLLLKDFFQQRVKQSIVLRIRKGNCPTILRNGLLIFKCLY